MALDRIRVRVKNRSTTSDSPLRFIRPIFLALSIRDQNLIFLLPLTTEVMRCAAMARVLKAPTDQHVQLPRLNVVLRDWIVAANHPSRNEVQSMQPLFWSPAENCKM